MASSTPLSDLVDSLRTLAEVSHRNALFGDDLITPLLTEAADQIDGFRLLVDVLGEDRARLVIENHLLRV